jgi:hypothetical protein
MRRALVLYVGPKSTKVVGPMDPARARDLAHEAVEGKAPAGVESVEVWSSDQGVTKRFRLTKSTANS